MLRGPAFFSTYLIEVHMYEGVKNQECSVTVDENVSPHLLKKHDFLLLSGSQTGSKTQQDYGSKEVQPHPVISLLLNKIKLGYFDPKFYKLIQFSSPLKTF